MSAKFTTMHLTKFPDSLRNARDLQLGSIYLKHLGYDNKPILLTIYELERPAILAYNEIKRILEEVRNHDLSKYGIKGLFSLAIAHLETMLSDLMKKQLQFFPQKIGAYKLTVSDNDEGKKNNKEISISKEMIYKEGMVENIIESEIKKISYKDIESQISRIWRIKAYSLVD